MKKLLIALALTGTAAAAAPASATVYDFTTTPVNGSIFSGSFDISGAAGSRTLNAFAGSFKGFTFSLGDVGLLNSGSEIIIGGKVSGINGVQSGTNDFFTGYFTPGATATSSGAIANTSGVFGFPTFTITEATAAVPEPATWALMILGMGAVGFAMRRRSKVNTTVRFA